MHRLLACTSGTAAACTSPRRWSTACVPPAANTYLYFNEVEGLTGGRKEGTKAPLHVAPGLACVGVCARATTVGASIPVDVPQSWSAATGTPLVPTQHMQHLLLGELLLSARCLLAPAAAQMWGRHATGAAQQKLEQPAGTAAEPASEGYAPAANGSHSKKFPRGVRRYRSSHLSPLVTHLVGCSSSSSRSTCSHLSEEPERAVVST